MPASHSRWRSVRRRSMRPGTCCWRGRGTCGRRRPSRSSSVCSSSHLSLRRRWRVELSALPWIAASAVLEIAYFALLTTAYGRSDLSLVYPIARGAAPVLVLVGASVRARRSAAGRRSESSSSVWGPPRAWCRRPGRPGRGSTLAHDCRDDRRVHPRRQGGDRARVRGPYLVLVLVPVAVVAVLWHSVTGRLGSVRAEIGPASVAAGASSFLAYALALGRCRSRRQRRSRRCARRASSSRSSSVSLSCASPWAGREPSARRSSSLASGSSLRPDPGCPVLSLLHISPASRNGRVAPICFEGSSSDDEHYTRERELRTRSPRGRAAPARGRGARCEPLSRRVGSACTSTIRAASTTRSASA